ncbi:TRAP transporter large permease [Salicibibacter kimchii]|uniref:TRAP transporter large permease n=1 Tax=Salicibibacter kimchii TaxID=2099786 RepID=A0A345BW72_9BACI|nr:TRAP transporter large permease [Salicibibacter kimchii]AXF55203.1 TRAP transporter large permease [Salicibibacter kimchii]
MSSITIGIIGIVVLLLMFAFRVPVSISLFIVGTVGYSLIRDVDSGLVQLATTPYSTASSYSLSVIPLFILMGMILSYSNLGKDLYNAVDSWLGRIRGGLAMTTIGTSAIFSSISGSINATTATMAKVAIPEMRKYNYDLGMASASVAAGGTLGPLIPPSVIMIVYGVLTMEPIGQLLIAGIIPGIIQMVIFMLIIYIWARIRPSSAPVGEKKKFGEKISSISKVWPFFLLFVMTIGGLYFGLFTPTEAGAVGAFGSFVLALITRRLSWESLKKALSETTRLTAMIFLILMGADIFSQFLSISRIPSEITTFVGNVDLSPLTILILMLIVYFILGLFLEGIAILVLTMPIVYPLLEQLGFDGVWFGVIMILVINIGLMTPPLGISIYVISGIVKDIPIQRIFKAVMPMVLAVVLCIIILIIFPEIVTILPDLMRG